MSSIRKSLMSIYGYNIIDKIKTSYPRIAEIYLPKNAYRNRQQAKSLKRKREKEKHSFKISRKLQDGEPIQEISSSLHDAVEGLLSLRK